MSRRERGLLDTSVVVAYARTDDDDLPLQAAIAAVTLAELVAGPLATTDPVLRAQRQDTLQIAAAEFEVLPLDEGAARAYGRVYAATLDRGRKARGPRALDLLIAATALAHDLPLFTANPDDVAHLDPLVEIVTARTR